MSLHGDYGSSLQLITVDSDYFTLIMSQASQKFIMYSSKITVFKIPVGMISQKYLQILQICFNHRYVEIYLHKKGIAMTEMESRS